MKHRAAAICVICAAASPGHTADDPQVIRFHGICDISAVAALDDQTLLAASDEENRLFSYTLDGGDPIAARGLNGLLSLPRNSDEIDIEAAAQGGGRIWWLGSHQPFRPRRNMIFATNVPNPDLADLAIVVPPFDLTRLLQSSPATRGLWHPTTWLEDPEDGGLNVEAAAVAPNGELLIGLRAPLDGPEGLSGAAIVLALSPEDPPRISKVHRIDLGDRGLRGMASVKDGYLLIAGPIDDEAASDVLFWRPGLPPRNHPHSRPKPPQSRGDPDDARRQPDFQRRWQPATTGRRGEIVEVQKTPERQPVLRPIPRPSGCVKGQTGQIPCQIARRVDCAPLSR